MIEILCSEWGRPMPKAECEEAFIKRLCEIFDDAHHKINKKLGEVMLYGLVPGISIMPCLANHNRSQLGGGILYEKN